MIDWQKIAVPRQDAADTQQIKELVEAINPEFIWPQAPGRLLQAEVRELDFVPTLTNVVSVEIDNEFVADMRRLLEAWPVYGAQINALLSAVYPVVHQDPVTKEPYARRTGMRGGSYGTRGKNVALHFGQVYGTADTPHGLAEAIVSSIGNWKLYAMGIKTREWDNTLITNSPEQQVRAQVRPGTEYSPLGAVLHAQYAILHILEWNLYQTRSDVYRHWAPWYKFGIMQHAARIERGLVTLQSIPEMTAAGEHVIGAICNWSTRLLEESAPWR
jgi:hypothetical protein